ncbi:MAG: IS256 family transposase, partial [Mycobacterium sp.]
MALDQSALTDLLDALRSGGDLDFMRDAMQLVLQALIELEATQVIGAARYERSDNRTNTRNGSRARLLSTKAGDVELAIPKLRHGSFFPALLEPRRRIDRALWAVIMEAFVHGVSTRKVDDLVAALGIDAGVSKSQVSRICAELDGAVAEFRERRLDHVEFPYVFVDATYVKAHEGARVVAKAVVVATGVTAEGNREVLGLAVGDSEDKAFWTAFLRSLRARGLAGVRLVISDAHEGLRASIERVMLGAAWQRCRVHFMLGVSLRSTGASSQVVTVPHRNQPWLYFMLAPIEIGCPRYELPG